MLAKLIINMLILKLNNLNNENENENEIHLNNLLTLYIFHTF